MAGIWDYNNRFVQSGACVVIPTTLSLRRTYRLNNWGNLSINEMYIPKRHLKATLCKGIRISESRREMYACGIRNPRLWNPDYCSRNPTNDWNPESRIQVPLKKTGIQYLQSGIHGVESRIQECLGSHGANGL